jgi:hypothetical protein
MHVKVVVGFVVDVVVEGGEVRGGSSGDEDGVGWEDFKGFSVEILFFRL